MTVRFSVTVRQVREDGSEVPADGELAAALAGPAEQFAGLLSWAADEAGFLDHGEREEVIGEEGRELQRRLLEATFAARQRAGGADRRRSPAPPGSGTAPSRPGTAGAWRASSGRSGSAGWPTATAASRTCIPADARWILPDDPYSLGMRALAAYHLAAGGYGQAQEVIEARTGVTVGRAQLAGLAEDLAAWTGDFYEERARDADTDLPDSDVIMMQADGKGIAHAPGAPQGRRDSDRRAPGDQEDGRDRRRRRLHPRRPRAGGHRRPARPPQGAPRPGRAGQVGIRLDHREHRGHDRGRRSTRPTAATRSGSASASSSSTGTSSRSPPSSAQAGERGLKVPVLIDYIHVSGYLGKAAAALHPGDPRRRRASGPTGSCSASCTAARRPSPPPSPPSPRRPAPTPGPATSTSPTWTGPSPT